MFLEVTMDSAQSWQLLPFGGSMVSARFTRVSREMMGPVRRGRHRLGWAAL
jgi:hypothetical protein